MSENQTTNPTHTDLMVSPESIDAFLEANPPPGATTLTLNSKTDCPHCDTARAFLTERGIPFTEIKHDDVTARQAMYDRLGLVGPARTVPQCVVSDAGEDWLIGGAAALVLSGVESLFVERSSPSLEPLHP